MNKSCLVIGRGLIGARIEVPGATILRCGHREAMSAVLSERPDIVVNAALDPKSLIRDLADDDLFEVRVARLLKPGTRYVTLSSRKVYGPLFQWGAVEGSVGEPASAYGRNKRRSECLVSEMLGEENTLIARLPNVFGLETRGSRASFFGIMGSDLLAKAEITFQFSGSTRRDFLYIDDCISLLSALISAGASGAFNVGYGTPVECGTMAMALISGFGRGRLTIAVDEVSDEFYLRTDRLRAAVAAPDLHGAVQGAYRVGRLLAETDGAGR